MGLKVLVKPERLHLDSAQHGPGAEEEKGSAGGCHPLGAPRRPGPPTDSAPAQVLRAPRGVTRGVTRDGADPPRAACKPGPRLHGCEAQGALSSLALGLSPLPEPAGGLLGAQRREGFLRQKSEVVAAQIPRLPVRHRAPGCAEVGFVTMETRPLHDAVGAGRGGARREGRGHASTRRRRPASPPGGGCRGGRSPWLCRVPEPPLLPGPGSSTAPSWPSAYGN